MEMKNEYIKTVRNNHHNLLLYDDICMKKLNAFVRLYMMMIGDEGVNKIKIKI